MDVDVDIVTQEIQHDKSEIFSKNLISESVTPMPSIMSGFRHKAGGDLGSTTFDSSSEYSTDSKYEEQNHPFGEHYIPMSHEIINSNKKKLGIINLFWPGEEGELERDGKEFNVHKSITPFKHTMRKSYSRVVLPTLIHSSTSLIYSPEYKTNSNKEKVLLLYAENFRRQYHVRFPTKKPLLLAAANECGIQKMVSTTIRPTKLCYPEMHTWRGCADLVADHIVYRPLDFPHLMPDELASGKTVLSRQKGHCFEMSTLLVSYLLAAGYDAYVVSGYATKDYCQNDLTRTDCPHVPDISQEVPKEEVVVEGKYSVRPPRDLRSKFLLKMEQRQKDQEERERQLELQEARRKIEELERPPHDPLYWWGVHSWVAVLPGRREVSEVLFIQPPSGVATGPSDPKYLGIESMWNQHNYWVNVQQTASCKELQFDLRDTSCWEHLLPGEPWDWQEVAKEVELDSRERVLLEKHLDMPASWVHSLDIPHYKFEQRYPMGSKCTFYKKAQVERFGPYLHDDGLVCRVTVYQDYECTLPSVEYTMYDHREDCLYRTIRYTCPETVIDQYHKGREDALMKQTRYVDESRRLMEFYHQVRHDSLRSLELNPLYMEEQFESREDRLYYRYVTFDARTKALNKWSLTDGSIHRTVTKIIEKFHRNDEVPADRDIARREFDIANEEININYHYAEGKITAGTRYFAKPPVQEQGDRLKFDASLTSGYVVDSSAPPQKKTELFWLLEACLQAEKDALKHIRDMEDEVLNIVRNVAMEFAEPKLKISIFDQERNSEAREGMKKQELLLKEQTVREVEAETDYLAVYLVQLGDKPLSPQKIQEVRQYCLSEYRQLLVDRANNMQHKFDKLTDELQAKHEWYENLGVNAGHDDDETYKEIVQRLAFELHTLELRLLRHRDLAPARYAALSDWLAADPRLRQT